jgi:hypothetical protein
MLLLQVYAAASDVDGLVGFVERYARHIASASQQNDLRLLLKAQQQQQQQQLLVLMEVQRVVAAAIHAAVAMGAPELTRYLLRLLPLLGCTEVDEPSVGAAVQAAIGADVSVVCCH